MRQDPVNRQTDRIGENEKLLEIIKLYYLSKLKAFRLCLLLFWNKTTNESWLLCREGALCCVCVNRIEAPRDAMIARRALKLFNIFVC